MNTSGANPQSRRIREPSRGNTNIRQPWLEDWKGYLGVDAAAQIRAGLGRIPEPGDPLRLPMSNPVAAQLL